MFSKVIQTVLVTIVLAFSLAVGAVSIVISWGTFLALVPAMIFYYPFMWVIDKIVTKKVTE